MLERWKASVVESVVFLVGMWFGLDDGICERIEFFSEGEIELFFAVFVDEILCEVEESESVFSDFDGFAVFGFGLSSLRAKSWH